MKRRDFLLRSMALGTAGLTVPSARLFAAPDGYTGDLLVVLQADGGWDVTSYCDPKVNQPGELKITNWSDEAGIQSAGNIPYAPFANNAWFFDKYYRDLLVINGVDVQTNSHTTGVLHSWSGRNARGYPTLTAMFAADRAPGLPLSYINFGGFGDTGGLIRFSRLDNVNALRQILTPENNPWTADVTDRAPEDMARIRQYRRERLARMREDPANLVRKNENIDAYDQALASKSELSRFAAFVPSQEDVFENVTVNNEIESNLFRQVQLAIATFEAGVASAADLMLSGFDTHQDHDTLHEPLLGHMNEAIDLLWTMAEARGLADRLTVVVGSDFSRTPHYNADDGKDHWPIGSVMVMAKDAPWGNRVVGHTDEFHNASTIQPSTLAVDPGGTLIYPKHVHKAIRQQLGLTNIAADSNFAFTATEDFGFFDPALQT